MTTSTPSDSTNNQSPLNTGLPDLTSVPTSTIPSGTFPTENIPKVIEPVVVQPIVGVPTATTSVINTNSTNVPVTEVKLPSELLQASLPEDNVQPVQQAKSIEPILTTGPSIETKAELPGQSLDLTPGLSQKILPESNTSSEVKSLDQLKTSAPVEQVVGEKRKVKDILLIVGILVAGIVALVFGIYIASNAV